MKYPLKQENAKSVDYWLSNVTAAVQHNNTALCFARDRNVQVYTGRSGL